MTTAKFVKSWGLFVACFIIAFVLSMHGMPLNTPTLAVADYAYQTFGNSLNSSYEEGADPVTFTALFAVNLVYALILFAVLKRLFIAARR
ncbi:Uncharacterised protein [Serratia ficaria]|nr:Uncharacterised protein [Serratia ficaria]CAI1709760.1 Uncharacterised protein [Serratia ficaria]CAI2431336.1 Uncharacterised protein [Serratia ficaria]CAI2789466.1 Uncharacterised protein [Serratia ficaria]